MSGIVASALNLANFEWLFQNNSAIDKKALCNIGRVAEQKGFYLMPWSRDHQGINDNKPFLHSREATLEEVESFKASLRALTDFSMDAPEYKYISISRCYEEIDHVVYVTRLKVGVSQMMSSGAEAVLLKDVEIKVTTSGAQVRLAKKGYEAALIMSDSDIRLMEMKNTEVELMS